MAKTYGITLMLGDADHQNTNTLVRELAQGFEDIGYHANLIVASDLKSPADFIRRLAKSRTVLIIAMAGLGLDTRAENNLFNQTNIPVLTILLDHPLHYWERAHAPIRNNPVSGLSPQDVAFMSAQMTHKKKQIVLNHGVNVPDKLPVGERDIDLFFCATLRGDPDVQRAGWVRHGADVERRLNDILDHYTANRAQTLCSSVAHVLTEEGLAIDAMRMQPYYVCVDLYIRDFLRVQALKQASELDLVLAGPGWENVLARYANPRVTYIGEQTPQVIETYMKRSKMALNAMPDYHVSHERVLRSAAYGALAVSSHSPFFEEHLGEGDWISFDPFIPDFAAHCRALLNDPDRLRYRTFQAFKTVKAQHSWATRCLDLSAALKLPKIDQLVKSA